MMKNQRKNILRNERGILTLDFIFAIIMMFSFAAILFGFSITFSAIEMAQYATFASARAHFAGHKNTDEQKRHGEAKFNAIVRSPQSDIGMLFRNGWFTLGEVKISDFSSEFGGDAGSDSDTFIGARARLTANVLSMKFPLLGGPTTDEPLGADISSYLMREPTEEECTQFVSERFTYIQTLKAGFSSGTVDPSAYAIMMDDGC